MFLISDASVGLIKTRTKSKMCRIQGAGQLSCLTWKIASGIKILKENASLEHILLFHGCEEAGHFVKHRWSNMAAERQSYFWIMSYGYEDNLFYYRLALFNTVYFAYFLINYSFFCPGYFQVFFNWETNCRIRPHISHTLADNILSCHFLWPQAIKCPQQINILPIPKLLGTID